MAEHDRNSDDEEAPAAPNLELRVDQAHSLRRAVQARGNAVHVAVGADAAAEGAGAEESPLADFEVLGAGGELDADALLSPSPMMLAQHAANLADRLQERLAAVDRRESRLNSQEAEFDTRVRNARLWMEQRDAEIAEQQQRLDAWEQDLRQRQEAAALQFEEAAELQQRLKELAHREKAAEALALELQLGRTEQQTKTDALDFEIASCRTRQKELDDARQKCEQRQRELDHREAKLYVDHEQASHERLALDARQAQLRDQESAAATREASLAACHQRLTEEAGAIEFQRAELRQAVVAHQEQTAALADAEKRLEFRRREIETAVKRYERLGIIEEKMAEVQAQRDAFAMRGNYLDHAEALLAEREMLHAEHQRELELERLAFQNQINKERRSLQAEHESSQAEEARRRREFDRREATLDHRQQAVEELAEQLRATQREALEIRLATEETWLQLQGALAPATLSRSIAQVRSRLMEHFKLAADEAKASRHSLETVRQELAGTFKELEQQRAELQQWACGRDEYIEGRATRLVARESELDAQQRQYEDRERQWAAERAQYQHELQRLLAELRGSSRLAA